MIPATQVKTGNCVVIDGDPYVVIERRHVTQGRKPGKIQLKLRNVITGLQTEKRYASSDKVEVATLEEKQMQYLYEDGDFFHFMNTETYEQIALDTELIGDNRYYLVDGLIVSVMFFSGIQLMSLGIIGEYIGRIFAEVKRRPLYVVADRVGAAAEAEAASVRDDRRLAQV